MTKEKLKQLYMIGLDAIWTEIDIELARNMATINRLQKHSLKMRDIGHKYKHNHVTRYCTDCKKIYTKECPMEGYYGRDISKFYCSDIEV